MQEVVGRIMEIWSSLPDPVTIVIVIALGLALATGLRFVIWKVLSAIRFDRFSERIGVSEFLRKGRAKYAPSRLVGILSYWVTLLAVMLEVAKILNPDLYAAISGKIVGAVPDLLAALFIMVVGSIIVSFLSNFSLTIALNASLPYAQLLAKAIKWLGIIIVVTISLEQAGLGRSIVEFVFEMTLAAATGAAAIAFGFGCKDLARGYMQRIINNLRERERAARGNDLEG